MKKYNIQYKIKYKIYIIKLCYIAKFYKQRETFVQFFNNPSLFNKSRLIVRRR